MSPTAKRPASIAKILGLSTGGLTLVGVLLGAANRYFSTSSSAADAQQRVTTLETRVGSLEVKQAQTDTVLQQIHESQQRMQGSLDLIQRDVQQTRVDVAAMRGRQKP